MTNIRNAKILIMATDGFEQSELMVPLEKLKTAGATVSVTSPSETRESGKIRGWDGGEWGKTVGVDLTLDEAEAADFDAIVIPGGQMNPDKLRTEKKAVRLVRDFAAAGKPVAAICHGPWLLVEAGLVEGRRATSYGSIKTDMVNAGADWVDEEVVTDNGIITSRKPDDLEAFVGKIIEEVQEKRHSQSGTGAKAA